MFRTMMSVMFVLFLCAPVVATEIGEERTAAYWAQFTATHTTEVPVTDWLCTRGEFALLWEGQLNARVLSIFWDANNETVVIDEFVGGWWVFIDDLEMGNSSGGRPTWQAQFNGSGQAQLSGMVDVDEVNELVVLGITMGDSYRMWAAIDPDPGMCCVMEQPSFDPSIAPTTSCQCFGKGTQTKTCSTQDCDDYDTKCGGSRTCRWGAA